MVGEFEIPAEHHRSHKVPWLRAAVMGANDGIVSTASLVIGVAAAGASRSTILTAGIAGLVAGAMSMAAGEYISVSSLRDTQLADLRIEATALADHPEAELDELSYIYEQRGLEPDLARRVAEQLMAHDMLEAHARDELGITDIATARPFEAAWASAAAFTTGATIPVVAVALAPVGVRIGLTAIVALLALLGLGALGAIAGGAPWRRAAVRALSWSSLAMLLTYVVGNVVGTRI